MDKPKFELPDLTAQNIEKTLRCSRTAPCRRGLNGPSMKIRCGKQK